MKEIRKVSASKSATSFKIRLTLCLVTKSAASKVADCFLIFNKAFGDFRKKFDFSRISVHLQHGSLLILSNPLAQISIKKARFGTHQNFERISTHICISLNVLVFHRHRSFLSWQPYQKIPVNNWETIFINVGIELVVFQNYAILTLFFNGKILVKDSILIDLRKRNCYKPSLNIRLPNVIKLTQINHRCHAVY